MHQDSWYQLRNIVLLGCGIYALSYGFTHYYQQDPTNRDSNSDARDETTPEPPSPPPKKSRRPGHPRRRSSISTGNETLDEALDLMDLVVEHTSSGLDEIKAGNWACPSYDEFITSVDAESEITEHQSEEEQISEATSEALDSMLEKIKEDFDFGVLPLSEATKIEEMGLELLRERDYYDMMKMTVEHNAVILHYEGLMRHKRLMISVKGPMQRVHEFIYCTYAYGLLQSLGKLRERTISAKIFPPLVDEASIGSAKESAGA